jgi:hypothetical protein
MHFELGVLITPSHYSRAMQIIKQRGLANFTCTPGSPILSSHKGDIASLPYYSEGASLPRQLTPPREPAAAAASHVAAAAATPVAPASACTDLPPLPIVRLMLLPPLNSTVTTAAPSRSAGGAKRARDDATDLTGDDNDDEQNQPAPGGGANSAAKRSRTDTFGLTQTPGGVSAGLSTEPIRASAPTATAPLPLSQKPLVHTVICPLPYNPFSRKYAASGQDSNYFRAVAAHAWWLR